MGGSISRFKHDPLAFHSSDARLYWFLQMANTNPAWIWYWVSGESIPDQFQSLQWHTAVMNVWLFLNTNEENSFAAINPLATCLEEEYRARDVRCYTQYMWFRHNASRDHAWLAQWQLREVMLDTHVWKDPITRVYWNICAHSTLSDKMKFLHKTLQDEYNMYKTLCNSEANKLGDAVATPGYVLHMDDATTTECIKMGAVATPECVLHMDDATTTECVKMGAVAECISKDFAVLTKRTTALSTVLECAMVQTKATLPNYRPPNDNAATGCISLPTLGAMDWFKQKSAENPAWVLWWCCGSMPKFKTLPWHTSVMNMWCLMNTSNDFLSKAVLYEYQAYAKRQQHMTKYHWFRHMAAQYPAWLAGWQQVEALTDTNRWTDPITHVYWGIHAAAVAPSAKKIHLLLKILDAEYMAYATKFCVKK